MKKGQIKIIPSRVVVTIHEPIIPDDESFNDSSLLIKKVKDIIAADM